MTLCFGIATIAFWTGLIGLGMDLVAALIVVLTDLPIFEKIWRSDSHIEKSERLRRAKLDIYSNPGIDENHEAFEEILKILEDFAKTDHFSPEEIFPPMTAGPSQGNFFIIQGPGGSNGVEAYLADQAIDREISKLQSGARTRVRRRAIGLLSLGFTFQIISYLLNRSGLAQELFVQLSFC